MTESNGHPKTEPILAEFEGTPISEMVGKLPAITMQMDEGYPRGTHLRMMVEVRVRNVRYEEDRRGGLSRQHVFALEEAHLVAVFDPEQAVDTVQGSGSAHPVPTPEEAEEIGLQFGRSSDTWGANGASVTEVSKPIWDPGF